MITHRWFACCVSAAGFTLAACGTTPPPAPEPPPAKAPEPAPRPPVVAVREPAPVPVAAKPEMLQFTAVEFFLPPERAAAVAAETPSFDALMAEAKAGKIQAVPVSLVIKDSVTCTLKQASVVRYPESYGPVFPDVAPLPPGVHDAAAKPTPNPEAPAPVVPVAPPRTVDGKLQLLAQDVTEREVGLMVEFTPSLSLNRKFAELDMKWKRVEMDAAVGETEDAFGCPSQPRFSVHDVQCRGVLALGATVHLATVSPSELSKDRRVRVIFVRLEAR